MLAFGKAEAEEQVKLVQEKLSKGMTQEVVASVSAIEIDKAKLRIPKKHRPASRNMLRPGKFR